MTTDSFKCSYCGEEFMGTADHSTHRDGFGEGPEIPLCDYCGGPDVPMDAIWAKTSKKDELLRERLQQLRRHADQLLALAPDVDVDVFVSSLLTESHGLLELVKHLRDGQANRIPTNKH